MIQFDLSKLGSELHDTFHAAKPFPHVLLDNFFSNDLADAAAALFPNPSVKPDDWLHYSTVGEEKFAFKNPESGPLALTLLLNTLNSEEFVGFVEQLSGIRPLIPDPAFHGAGIQCSPPGGKLFMHVDFPLRPSVPKPHPQFPDPVVTPLYRRLNAILYLNPHWKESYGGHLEMRTGSVDEHGIPHMASQGGVRILPIHNRLLFFQYLMADFMDYLTSSPARPMNCAVHS